MKRETRKAVTLLSLSLLAFLQAPPGATAKEITPCIKKSGKFWRTTKEQCLQLTKKEAEGYREALTRLKALEEFLRETAPLIKRTQQEVKKLKSNCEEREKALKAAIGAADKRADTWKEKFLKLIKKKEVPVPFYRHPAFIFAAGVVLGGTITGLVAGIVTIIQRR